MVAIQQLQATLQHGKASVGGTVLLRLNRLFHRCLWDVSIEQGRYNVYKDGETVVNKTANAQRKTVPLFD